MLIDYGIINYAKLKDTPARSSEAKELSDYTNSLLTDQILRNRYVEQVCLTLTASSRTLCSQNAEGSEVMETHVKGPNRSFEPLEAESSKFNGYILTYTESVMDKSEQAGAWKGHHLVQYEQVVERVICQESFSCLCINGSA